VVGQQQIVPKTLSILVDKPSGGVRRACEGNHRRDGLAHYTVRDGANMAKQPKYQVEKTDIGLQYVIPGAERVLPVASPSAQYTTEGAQFVIPGAEQISTRELLTRLMAQPIRPRRGQKSLRGTALFSPLGS